MTRRTRTAVAALALAAVSVGCTTALAEPASDHPPHVARRDGASAPLPLAAVGGEHPEAVIAWIEGEQRARWYAGVELAEREAQQAREAAARPVSRSTGGGGGSCAGDVACFLACTRAHESDTAGGYGAVSPSGTYRGAYQFAQATWDAAVAGAGWAEYAGMPADQAPPWVQDAAAAHLYGVSGNAPWLGRC